MSKKSAMRKKLAQHPRLIGLIFSLSILLVQFGGVLAGGGGSNGP